MKANKHSGILRILKQSPINYGAELKILHTEFFLYLFFFPSTSNSRYFLNFRDRRKWKGKYPDLVSGAREVTYTKSNASLTLPSCSMVTAEPLAGFWYLAQ